MKKCAAFLLACSVLATLFPALAAGELGDPAAPLQISEWIKGGPVDLAAGKGKTIYVVEFWATWCPPCRASIPHLSDLQKKFKDKDIVFVGISDEDAATVKPFVEKMGDKMNYTVALDKGKKTSAAYMEAFGIGGIPHAFVVDKEGRIIWQGHPMAELEETLQKLVDGKYDLSIAKKQALGRKQFEEFCTLVADGKENARADELAKQLEALCKEVDGIVPGNKFDAAAVRKSVRFDALVRGYRRAAGEGKKADELDKLAEQLESVAPAGFNLAEFKKGLRMEVLFGQYYKLVSGSGDDAKAAELGAQMLALDVKDPNLLNQVAWTLLTNERIKTRDYGLATKVAKAACDACDGKDASVVDTYARALFDSGKVEEAVRAQKQAVSLCKDAELGKQLEATLKQYERKAEAK